MGEITPLTVTLELPASEMMEHEGNVYVRCPLNRQWIPLTDYYSELQGSLLPLVGNASYEDAPDHWVDKREIDTEGNPIGPDPIMVKEAKTDAITWKETVRILAPTAEQLAEPEGGALSFGVHDEVKSDEQFG